MSDGAGGTFAGRLTGMSAFQAGGEEARNSSMADMSSSSKPYMADVSFCQCAYSSTLTVLYNSLVVTHKLIRDFDLIVAVAL